VTTMLSPIMMLSSRCLESTSIAGSFLSMHRGSELPHAGHW
jgi:hypothetical protein